MLTKGNFRAWSIDYRKFYGLKSSEERMRFLVGYGVLAPSSHNSQPWGVKLEKGVIDIYGNFERALRVGDKENRLLYASLGCFAENIVTAADYYGYKCRIAYFPDGSGKGVAMRIKLSEPKNFVRKINKKHLIHYINKRMSNRSPYRRRSIDNRVFKGLEKGLRNGVKLLIIQRERLRTEVADVVIRAGVEAMEKRDFRNELSEYIKANITKSKLGMPAYGYLIPTPISHLAPFGIRLVNMNKLNRKKDFKILVEYTPAFGIISSKEDSEKAWIDTGRLYQRVALGALRKGIATHPMAAPVVIGKYYKELSKVIGIEERVHFFFRIGIPSIKIKHSPRMDVDEILM